MAYAEYPSTHYADTDAHELIHLYRKLTDDYTQLLSRIIALENTFNTFKTQVEESARELVQQAIDSYKTRIDQALAAIPAQVSTRVDSLFNAAWGAKESTVDGKVSEWQSKIDSAVSDMQEQWQALQGQVLEWQGRVEKEVEEKVDGKLGEIEERVSAVEKRAEETLGGVKGDASEYLTELGDNLKGEVKDELDNFEKRLEEVEKKNDDGSGGYVYNWLVTTGGMTAKEWWDYHRCDCDWWNCTGVTCYEWAMNGKDVLGYNGWLERYVNPLSGEEETVGEALTDFMLKFAGGMSAGEYDKLGITAEEFDSWRIKAQNWDWRGGELDGLFRKNIELESTAV